MSEESIVVVVAPTSTAAADEPATKAELAEHAAEDKQEVAGAETKAETELAAHMRSATHLSEEQVRSIAQECLAEYEEILDECGRHIMMLEAGGEEISPTPNPATPDGTTPNGSSAGTSSEPLPVSPSGTEAVVVVEAPVPVSPATVMAQERKRGFFGTLVFGRQK